MQGMVFGSSVPTSLPHRRLDAKTAVTFVYYPCVCFKRVPTILARANNSLTGHPQQDHETRHGSMSRTRWTVDGPDEVPLEIEGRKFSTNDEGAPMMCNLVCSAMGRHVHIDYCRADDAAACAGNEELQHLTRRIQPNPARAKDLLTHSLFWKRSGEWRLGASVLVDRLSELLLNRFQRPILEGRTSQLWEMVGLHLDFNLVVIKI